MFARDRSAHGATGAARRVSPPGNVPRFCPGLRPRLRSHRVAGQNLFPTPRRPRGRPAVRGAQPPPPAERSAPTAASPPGLGVPERCICYPPGRPRSPTPCKNQTRGNRYASFKPSALECVSARTGRWPSGGSLLSRSLPLPGGTEGVRHGNGSGGERWDGAGGAPAAPSLIPLRGPSTWGPQERRDTPSCSRGAGPRLGPGLVGCSWAPPSPTFALREPNVVRLKRRLAESGPRPSKSLQPRPCHP